MKITNYRRRIRPRRSWRGYQLIWDDYRLFLMYQLLQWPSVDTSPKHIRIGDDERRIKQRMKLQQEEEAHPMRMVGFRNNSYTVFILHPSMMTLRLRVDSISCFCFCVFALSFLVTTLVSQPYRRPDQAETLLAFKNEFSICNNSTTSSWTEDTASFDGVVFDGETGAVTELHLGGACLTGSLKANSSLYRFHHLRYLDLSVNDFSSSFPAEFGRLTNLEFLDLHHNGFTGEVPSSIRNLSRLTSLDLSVNKLTGVNTLVSLPYQIDILLAFKDEFPSPTCRQTVLSSWTRNTPQDTNSFDGVVFDNETGVVTELHLDEACLRGTIKTNSSLFRFLHLRYLDLSYNNFESSSFPAEFGRLANLEVLKVRDNGLVGEVPSSIHNLSRLTFLDLSKNKLSGGFPLVYNLTKLSSLDLSFNKFSGTIPSSLLTMPSLLKLDLRQNHLRDSLELLNSSSSSKLESLYLGRNFFTGRILEPISKLVKLTDLDLSFLNMIYPISIVFLPLKSLKYLDLSGNSVSRLNTSSDHALTKLIELNLSNCNIVEFPNYLATLQSLEYLDLSGNSLSSSRKLSLLDLSYNNLSGPIPRCFGSIDGTMYLHHNNLNGKLPDM
ncbi:unnamed protein product [Thlaspi arvense]|uniref:Uncharacterized protein n=1 Tax=Thlaspi arvense TaxID=13288 RepID=A0AAU9RGS8_THLAR|nr:unnamed protein product [Thlaspi arvense]